MRPRSRFRLLAFIAVITASTLAPLGLPAAAFAQSPTLSVSPTSGPPGQKVTLTGQGFTAYPGDKVEIDISIDHGNGNWDLLVAGAAYPVPDGNGNFSVSITIPSSAPPGDLLAISSISEPEADAFFTVTGSSGTGTSAPAAPSNLAVTAVDPNDIKLTWHDNSSNETGFEINNGVISKDAAANSTSYTWGGLAPGTYMCFKIRAYNGAGDSVWDPNVSPWYVCTTTPKPVPRPKSCPTVLLGLHGFREGPPNTKKYLESPEILSTFRNFERSMAAEGHSPKDYIVWDVPYPITDWQYLDNPFKLRTIVSDVVDGSGALQKAVQHFTALCSKSNFELVGYSEGAWVVDYWLHFHQSEAGSHVKAVELYGDPNYYQAYGHDVFGFVAAYQGLSRIAGLTFGWYGPPYPAPNTAYKVQTFCIPHDPVCGLDYKDTIAEHAVQFAAAAACLKAFHCPHLIYPQEGYTKRGGEFLAKHAF